MKKILLVAILLFSTLSEAKVRFRRPSFTGSAETATLRRIQEFEDQRASNVKLLRDWLFHPSKKVVRAALVALGRIGDTNAFEEIARVLNRNDNETKRVAAFALGLIGGDTSVKFLTQHLQMQKDPEVKAAILVAVGRAGGEANLGTFVNALKEESNPQVLEGAIHGLGILWTGNSEKWPVPPNLFARLAKFAQGNDSLALMSAFALARYKGDPAALPLIEIVDSAAKTPHSAARAFLCRVLGRVKSPVAAQALLKEILTNPGANVRIEAVKALSTQEPSEMVVSALGKQLLTEPSAGVVVALLETLANFGIAAAIQVENVDTVLKTSSSAWIKGNALKTLARIAPNRARPRVLECLSLPSLVPYAVNALGILATPADLEKLATYLNHPEVRVVEETVDAFGMLPEEAFPPGVKNIGLKKALERADPGITTLVAQVVEKYKWKDYAAPLAAVYRLLNSRDQIEAKVGILNALAVVGDHSHEELLQAATNDPDRLVVVAAVATLKAITGKDESAKIPLNSRISLPTPPAKELHDAVRTRVTLKTNRGDIQLVMAEEAPLSSANFVRLAKQNFYKGKMFHRVVPNFVVQGGDPRGDGYGGPGYVIRDEVSLAHHARGTVGIATAGKDTGGCQFFFNLGPNPHLDGKYTLFAEVAKGLDVLDKLEVGDQILSVRVN